MLVIFLQLPGTSHWVNVDRIISFMPLGSDPAGKERCSVHLAGHESWITAYCTPQELALKIEEATWSPA